MKLTILYPSQGHSAYKIAAETFADLARQTAAAESVLITDKDPIPDDNSPIAVIGTDAVNLYTADLYFQRTIDDFGIRYNTDDYRIQTLEVNGRAHLLLAGGRPRSTLYAVYRYFEKFCGCRWFWDGDRIPPGNLPFADIDLTESPRFEYRGLRYFAHRSLHRFQAEHWNLEDWQKEIDWIVKKRLNLFMLRIGLDDIFQKAFPDVVPYPDPNDRLPEALKGYDDRTLFWSLEYRGELRKKLLAYAFARDLMHPEDCGTMTHWYSRTPVSYLEKVKPTLLSGQVAGAYTEQTGLVWDIRDNENLNNYFKLTDTHVREYGKPELFHTIGLAERSFSSDREENMRLKLNVYRRIAAHLKENYPGAPLLIASWDLWMFYTPEEVQRLVSELDPAQSIILDYTSDTTRGSNFTTWGVMGKFPWIFGTLSGFEPNSDFRGSYDLTNERLQLAKADPMCKGMILWPELSHGDTFMTEYLTRNAWDSETPSIPELTDTYCCDRYPTEQCEIMQALWHRFMPIVKLRAWSQNPDGTNEAYDAFVNINGHHRFTGTLSEAAVTNLGEAAKNQENAVHILRTLRELPVSDTMLRRDIYDIARAILGRYVDFSIRLAEAAYSKKDSYMYTAMDAAEKLMGLLRDLMASHEDFSLLETLRRLRETAPVNPIFETTLKNNAESWYCRAYIYENAAYLYVQEMQILFAEVKKSFETNTEIHRETIQAETQKNRERFFEIPLADMQPASLSELHDVLSEAAVIIESVRFTI